MAHGGKWFDEQRKVRLDRQWRDHSNEGTRFRASDVIQHDGHTFLVVRSEGESGQFFLMAASGGSLQAFGPDAGDPHGIAYRPIHSSVTAEDVQGASYAWDDGTAWHFAHCSPAEQVDFAADVRTFIFGQFAEAVARATLKGVMATNSVVRERAADNLRALVDFATAVAKRGYAVVVGETLGHYHRNPHADHKRDVTVAAVAHVLADWKERALTDTAVRADRQRIVTAAGAVVAALGTAHTIVTRPERAAAEAAAAKAKAKEAEAEGEGAAPAEGD